MAVGNLTFNVTANTSSIPQSIVTAHKTAQAYLNRTPLNLSIKTQGLNNLDLSKSLPLGHMATEAKDFEKSMNAATSRVLAFTATVGSLYAVGDALKSIVTTTIEVERSLNLIKAISGTTGDEFNKLSNGIFKAAINTSTSFKEAAEAAAYFASQGLNTKESLDRVNASMYMTKITGVSLDTAMKSITATLNTFGNQLTGVTDLMDKMTAVDTAFAVSTKDISEGLSRVGNSAQEAKVSLTETMAAITALQVRTGRGGSVEGNALKSIFTRIGRPENIDLLNRLGIATEKVTGESRDAMSVLRDLAGVYKTLSDAERRNVSGKMAGLFQINQFQALLTDLGSKWSIVDQATQKANSSMGSSAIRMAEINKTTDALIKQTLTNFTQLQSKVGSMTFDKPLKTMLSGLTGGDSYLSKLLGLMENMGTDSASTGDKIGEGIFNGIGKFISGPGLIMLSRVIVPVLGNIAKYTANAFGSLGGSNQQLAQMAQLENNINKLLATGNQYYVQRYQQAKSVLQAEQALAGLIASSKGIGKLNPMVQNLYQRGFTAQSSNPADIKYAPIITGRFRKALVSVPSISSGYNPVDEEQRAIATSSDYAGHRNARPKMAKVRMGGHSRDVVINDHEKVIPNYGNTGDDAILNPRQQRMGFSRGYVPNYMASIKRSEMVAKILEGGEGIFGAEFTKRTTGETRTGTFRLAREIQKGKVGGQLPYTAKNHSLIPVFDMGLAKKDGAKEAYRMIPYEGIHKIHIAGQSYDITNGAGGIIPPNVRLGKLLGEGSFKRIYEAHGDRQLSLPFMGDMMDINPLEHVAAIKKKRSHDFEIAEALSKAGAPVPEFHGYTELMAPRRYVRGMVKKQAAIMERIAPFSPSLYHGLADTPTSAVLVKHLMQKGHIDGFNKTWAGAYGDLRGANLGVTMGSDPRSAMYELQNLRHFNADPKDRFSDRDMRYIDDLYNVFGLRIADSGFLKKRGINMSGGHIPNYANLRKRRRGFGAYGQYDMLERPDQSTSLFGVKTLKYPEPAVKEFLGAQLLSGKFGQFVPKIPGIEFPEVKGNLARVYKRKSFLKKHSGDPVTQTFLNSIPDDSKRDLIQQVIKGIMSHVQDKMITSGHFSHSDLHSENHTINKSGQDFLKQIAQVGTKGVGRSEGEAFNIGRRIRYLSPRLTERLLKGFEKKGGKFTIFDPFTENQLEHGSANIIGQRSTSPNFDLQNLLNLPTTPTAPIPPRAVSSGLIVGTSGGGAVLNLPPVARRNTNIALRGSFSGIANGYIPNLARKWPFSMPPIDKMSRAFSSTYVPKTAENAFENVIGRLMGVQLGGQSKKGADFGGLFDAKVKKDVIGSLNSTRGVGTGVLNKLLHFMGVRIETKGQAKLAGRPTDAFKRALAAIQGGNVTLPRESPIGAIVPRDSFGKSTDPIRHAFLNGSKAISAFQTTVPLLNVPVLRSELLRTTTKHDATGIDDLVKSVRGRISYYRDQYVNPKSFLPLMDKGISKRNVYREVLKGMSYIDKSQSDSGRGTRFNQIMDLAQTYKDDDMFRGHLMKQFEKRGYGIETGEFDRTKRAQAGKRLFSGGYIPNYASPIGSLMYKAIRSTARMLGNGEISFPKGRRGKLFLRSGNIRHEVGGLYDPVKDKISVSKNIDRPIGVSAHEGVHRVMEKSGNEALLSLLPINKHIAKNLSPTTFQKIKDNPEFYTLKDNFYSEAIADIGNLPHKEVVSLLKGIGLRDRSIIMASKHIEFLKKRASAGIKKRMIAGTFANGSNPLADAIGRESLSANSSSIYTDFVKTAKYTGPVVANTHDEPNRTSLLVQAGTRGLNASRGHIPNYASDKELDSMEREKIHQRDQTVGKYQAAGLTLDQAIKKMEDKVNRLIKQGKPQDQIDKAITKLTETHAVKSDFERDVRRDIISKASGFEYVAQADQRLTELHGPLANKDDKELLKGVNDKTKNALKYQSDQAIATKAQLDLNKKSITLQEAQLRVNSIGFSSLFKSDKTITAQAGGLIGIGTSDKKAMLAGVRKEAWGKAAFGAMFAAPMAAGMVESLGHGSAGANIASSALQGMGVGASLVPGPWGMAGGLAAGALVGMSQQPQKDSEKKVAEIEKRYGKRGQEIKDFSEMMQGQAQVKELMTSGGSLTSIRAIQQQVVESRNKIHSKGFTDAFDKPVDEQTQVLQEKTRQNELEKKRSLIGNMTEDLGSNYSTFGSRAAKKGSWVDSLAYGDINGFKLGTSTKEDIRNRNITNISQSKKFLTTEEQNDNVEALTQTKLLSGKDSKGWLEKEQNRYYGLTTGKSLDEKNIQARAGLIQMREMSGTDEKTKELLNNILDNSAKEDVVKEYKAFMEGRITSIKEMEKFEADVKKTVNARKVSFDISQGAIAKDLSNFATNKGIATNLTLSKIKEQGLSPFHSEETKSLEELRISHEESQLGLTEQRQSLMAGNVKQADDLFTKGNLHAIDPAKYSEAMKKASAANTPEQFNDAIKEMEAQLPKHEDTQELINGLIAIRTEASAGFSKLAIEERAGNIINQKQAENIIKMANDMRSINAMGGLKSLGNRSELLGGIGGDLSGARRGLDSNKLTSLNGFIGHREVKNQQDTANISAAQSSKSLLDRMVGLGVKSDTLKTTMPDLWQQIIKGDTADRQKTLLGGAKESAQSFLSNSKIGQFNPSIGNHVERSENIEDILRSLTSLKPKDSEDAAALKTTIESIKAMKETSENAPKNSKDALDAEFKVPLDENTKAVQENTKAQLQFSRGQTPSTGNNPTNTVTPPSGITTPTVTTPTATPNIGVTGNTTPPNLNGRKTDPWSQAEEAAKAKKGQENQQKVSDEQQWLNSLGKLQEAAKIRKQEEDAKSGRPTDTQWVNSLTKLKNDANIRAGITQPVVEQAPSIPSSLSPAEEKEAYRKAHIFDAPPVYNEKLIGESIKPLDMNARQFTAPEIPRKLPPENYMNESQLRDKAQQDIDKDVAKNGSEQGTSPTIHIPISITVGSGESTNTESANRIAAQLKAHAIMLCEQETKQKAIANKVGMTFPPKAKSDTSEATGSRL